MIDVRQTQLDGVVEIVPARHGDERGWFSEVWNRAELETHGIAIDWVQDNESMSAAEGTIRGVHFQRPPSTQDKLVRVVRGAIIDVAVDLRRSSATYGCHVAVELTALAGNQLLVPKGFGHGFVTLEPDCHIAYKVSAGYDKGADAAVNFADPELGIDWGIDPAKAVVSAKDAAAPMLGAAEHLVFE